MGRDLPSLLALGLLAAAGCYAGLDDGLLTRGGATPIGGGQDGGSGGKPAPPDLGLGGGADLGQGPCHDFANDAIGSLPAGWTADVGAWQIVAAGGAHALGQTGIVGRVGIASTGAPDNFIITATVIPADGLADDCVLARFQDPQNYYALCLTQSQAWKLIRVREGMSMILQRGMLAYAAGNASHLVLNANDDQISGSVEGSHFSITDGALQTGVAGVATASTSAFPLVCVVGQ